MKDKPVILVVEDDAAVRQGVVDALAFSGYEVIAAADGREGMERALRASYQLLLLDLVYLVAILILWRKSARSWRSVV